MRRSIPIFTVAIALLIAQSVGGRLQVRCLDGSVCPLTAPAAKATPCCEHQPKCHVPPALPPTCVVVSAPTVELSKPRPAQTPSTPFETIAPSATPLADLLAPKLVVVRTVSNDLPPAPAPPVIIHGPRAPPASSFA